MTTRTQIAVLYTLAAIAVAGIVLCFPWQIAGHGSCLLQSWISPDRALTPPEYVLPYGLLWWGSWTVLFLAVNSIRRIRRRGRTTGG
ncbi:MAG TPA: hypothetical protein ENK07_02590 [Bacteroidetes bacterium]|nr:hypothetical protein [Bacteroidota bacterium]